MCEHEHTGVILMSNTLRITVAKMVTTQDEAITSKSDLVLLVKDGYSSFYEVYDHTFLDQFKTAEQLIDHVFGISQHQGNEPFDSENVDRVEITSVGKFDGYVLVMDEF